MSFFDKIGTFFDIIPKIIYFMAAIFTSVIDILQCMVRKLAGLDVYWAQVANPDGTIAGTTPVAQQDPLTEFIYGILGYGESAPLYQGLNTVFWSLAIFAVICLVVTSMIAIIKSHYNEDANATNPWKYIYTAIKAVFTFAIVPFAVVIGMQLASWVLRTVDSITAGSATDATMRTYLGDGYKNVFEGDKLPGQTTETTYYSNYDFLGFGSVTTSTPFSGMIFKACTYNANRAREDSAFANAVHKIKDNKNYQVFGEAESSVADAVDFAFANNLQLTNGISRGNVTSVLVDELGGVNYWTASDLIIPLRNATSFSKFRVGFVWMFYNLWSFDFIVAFVGGVTVVGIMLSVIIGLMSRLMKGAILFLIYPALLGIAPLDNFKAFKSWTTQFIQQVMMAFGAIIGMNLTLLILPYAQNIKWFDPSWGWALNNLVNTIVMVTGLMMMKDIIAMISQFAGGADANAAGGALKAEVGKGIATGAKITGKAGLAVGRGAALAVGGAVKFGKKVGQGANTYANARKAGMSRKDARAAAHAAPVRAAESRQSAAETTAASAKTNLATMVGGSTSYAAYRAEQMSDLKNSSEYKKSSKSARRNMEQELNNKLDSEDSKIEYFNSHKKDFKHNQATMDAARDYGNATAEAEKAKAKKERIAKENGFNVDEDGDVDYSSRAGVIKRTVKPGALAIWDNFSGGIRDGYTKEVGSDGKTHYYDKNHNEVDRGSAMKHKNPFAAAWDEATLGNAGKHIADGFLKGLGDISSGVGLDKLQSGMADIFKAGFKLDGGVFDMKDPKLEGDKLTSSEHEKTRLAQQKASEDSTAKIVKAIENLEKKTGGDSSGISKAAADMKVATNDLKKVAEALGKLKGGS